MQRAQSLDAKASHSFLTVHATACRPLMAASEKLCSKRLEIVSPQKLREEAHAPVGRRDRAPSFKPRQNRGGRTALVDGNRLDAIKPHIPFAQNDFEARGGIGNISDTSPKRLVIRNEMPLIVHIAFVEQQQVFSADGT